MAIASNFYWLNVARFYAGCYDIGQLASLLESSRGPANSKSDFAHIDHVSNLGLFLLADYVLSQSPKLVIRLADRITEN